MAFFDLAQMEKVHAKASSKIKRLGRSVSQRRMPRETEKPPLTMIDEKPTDGTSTSKKDQDGHRMMKSENFLKCSVHTLTEPRRRIEKNFLSRWTWRDECSFFLQSFSNRFFLVEISYTCSGNYSVYDGEVYIHSPVARTFFCCTVCLRTFAHLHACAHTRMAQVSVKRLFVAWVSLFSISPSSLSCLTRLCCSRTVTSRSIPTMTSLTIHMFLPYFPVLKAQDTRHSAHASRSLATWPSQMQTQGMSPNEFDKIISVDDDTMLINDPNHNFFDFLKTRNENTRQFGVPTVFESSVLHVSHDGFALRIESKESMQSGNRCQTEGNRKKKVLWSVLQSRCQRKVNATVLVWVRRVTEKPVLKNHRKFCSFLMIEISEDTWNEELNKLFLVKIQITEDYTLTEYDMEIQNLERRNSE